MIPAPPEPGDRLQIAAARWVEIDEVLLRCGGGRWFCLVVDDDPEVDGDGYPVEAHPSVPGAWRVAKTEMPRVRESEELSLS